MTLTDRKADPETLRPWGDPSAETVAFSDTLQKLLADLPPPEEIDINAARRLRAEGKGLLPIDGPRAEARWVETATKDATAHGGPNRARLIETPNARGVYVHIHGGGWTFGSPEHFDGGNLQLAQTAGVTVVAPQYRLAPEDPWPACAEDCFVATIWALDYATERRLPLVIGGESAGAHLSVATLLRLRDIGRIKEVVGTALAYGCFDLRGTPSMRNWGARNLVLSTPVVRWFVHNLLGASYQHGDPETPSVSPLLANLTDMPPALLFVGDADPLLDDTLFMAQRWLAAGGKSTLRIWPGAVHGFDYFTDPKFNLPIARESQQELAQFVKDRVEAARAP